MIATCVLILGDCSADSQPVHRLSGNDGPMRNVQRLVVMAVALAAVAAACGSEPDPDEAITAEETVVAEDNSPTDAPEENEAVQDGEQEGGQDERQGAVQEGEQEGGERPERPAGDGDGRPEDEQESAEPDVPVDSEDAAMRTEIVRSAQWADDVTITIDGNTVRFESDGLPSHEYLDAYLADGPDGKYLSGGAEAYDASFEFPLVPEAADSPSETSNGPIGVAISGAVYFDPYEANGEVVANDDNDTIDGVPFIDACGGHPIPRGTDYHYHGIPYCITDAVDTPGAHSTLIGFLFDGFPIYGPQDSDGEEPTDLDECHGHVGPTPEFDDDTYHYHIISTSNYISECLSGVS